MKPIVILVEPRGVEANVFAKYLTLPLMGPIYLGTILRHAGFEVRVYNENILGRPLRMSELDADVLCLSPLTATANRAYELARQFKAQNPRGRVLIGGIHASFMPEEAARFADTVVVGEGENVITDLVAGGSSEQFVSGSQVADMDSLPLPDFDLLAGSHKMASWPIMASRGCPHACNFCSVTQMFGRKYRAASVERVMEELRRARRRIVFFYDDNFAANRDRTHQLLDRMCSADLRLQWSCQVRADVSRDRELVRKMRQAGCRRVYVGFESINPKALAGMHKGQNVEEVARAIEVFHQSGIAIHGMFIFGSDEDTQEIFEATARFCRRKHVDTVQFMILTPLPGTETFGTLQREGRLLHTLWQYYDGNHAVFQPLNMTARELQDGMLEAFYEFYSYTHILNEALNESFDAGMRVAKFMVRRRSYALAASSSLKTFAAMLVRRWQKLNKDYLYYLRQLDRMRAPQAPGFSHGDKAGPDFPR